MEDPGGGALDNRSYLKVRARAGLPLLLAWRRFGRFEVYLESGKATVRGPISPSFGGFRGDSEGPNQASRRSRRCVAQHPGSQRHLLCGSKSLESIANEA